MTHKVFTKYYERFCWLQKESAGATCPCTQTNYCISFLGSLREIIPLIMFKELWPRCSKDLPSLNFYPDYEDVWKERCIKTQCHVSDIPAYKMRDISNTIKQVKFCLQQNNDYFQHILENLDKDTHWFQLSILFFISRGCYIL